MKKHILFLELKVTVVAILVVLIKTTIFAQTNLNEEFFKSVKGNNIELVKRYYKEGADVNYKGDKGWSALHQASYDGNFEMVKYLLSLNPSMNIVNDRGSTPLMMAVSNYHFDICKLLIDSKADINYQRSDGLSALLFATLRGWNEADDLRIRSGQLKKEELSFILFNANENQCKMLKLLLENGANAKATTSEGANAIHIINKTNIDAIKMLFAYGSDVYAKDRNGKTALDNFLTYLNTYGASYYNAQTEYVVNFLKSPSLNNTDLLELGLIHLIKEKVKADKNALFEVNNLGQGLLHQAVFYGEEDLIKFLLKSGADIDQRDNTGRTSLLYAVFLTNQNAAELLINSGAGLNTADNNGETPLSVASRRNDKYLMNLLVSKGAKMNIAIVRPQLIVPIGHSTGINSVVLSHNNNYLFTSSSDNNIKCWDIRLGKPIKTYKGCSKGLHSIDVSPDDQFLAAVTEENTVNIWDIATGELLRSINSGVDGISSIRFSHDGKALIGIVLDHIAFFDFKTGRVERNFRSFKIPATLALSSDGRFVLTGNTDSTISLWDINKGEVVRSFSGHKGVIYSLCFLPDNKRFVSCSPEDKSIKVWNINSTEEIRVIGDMKNVMQVRCSPDGKYISGGAFTSVTVFDANTYESINSFEGGFTDFFQQTGEIIICFHKPSIYNVLSGEKKDELYSHNFVVSKSLFIKGDRGFIESVYGGDVVRWNLETCRIEKRFSGEKGTVVSMCLNNGGDQLLTGTMGNFITLWDLDSETPIREYPVQNKAITSICFSPDDKTFLSGDFDKSINLWNKEENRAIRSFYGHSEPIFSLLYFRDNTFLSGSFDGTICLWNTKSSRPMKTYKTDSVMLIDHWSYAPVICVDIFPGKNLFAAGIDNGVAKMVHPDSLKRLPSIKIGDFSSGKVLYTLFGHKGVVNSVDFSAKGDTLVSGSEDNSIIIWRVNNGQIVKTLDGHNDGISSVNFSGDNTMILSSSSDNTVKLWDVSTGKEIASFICGEYNDWMCVTPDNYYFSSKNFAKRLSFGTGGLDVFSFDQFDLQYNRPDKVLEKIGLSDTSTIKAYRLAYYKRLKKMNFTENMFSLDYHMPEIDITNSTKFKEVATSGEITLAIKATDTKYKLDRINIWVNETPILGVKGIDLRSNSSQIVEKLMPVLLSDGKNKIEVSCLNEKGVESYKETLWITYQPEKPILTNKYLIAISVSDYKDASHNLKYAVKDGRDMARLFAGKDFSIDTLFNQNATRENIIALKQKLMQTKVDDEVILYVSGHGLLDKNYDFYFATYDINFEDPAEKGILYDDLEGLLDGIPARKKLLLMDACHSGEVDKDEMEEKDAVADLGKGKKGDIKIYGYKGTIIEAEGSGLGLQNSFELMQELFANLSRGSGAVVISAAAGTGYALESPEWNNGVFTYCILNGLKNLAADANGDKTVTVSELKDYVSKEVERLTNGAQKPTSRRESLEFDWGVW